MFQLEKSYDVDEIVRHNMHTHTYFSRCANPEMSLRKMIAKAEESGLKTLAITDHSDLEDGIDTFANTIFLKTQLQGISTSVRVLIGSELSAYGVGKFSEPPETTSILDYRNYSHVHYHLDYWEQPRDRTPAGYAAHMLDVLRALFQMESADCIAHPFSPMKMKFFDESQKKETLCALTDLALGEIMEMGEKAGCAWEIHYPTFYFYPEFGRRFFRIGQEVGVHFAFGRDAHSLPYISTEGCAEVLKNIIQGE